MLSGVRHPPQGALTQDTGETGAPGLGAGVGAYRRVVGIKGGQVPWKLLRTVSHSWSLPCRRVLRSSCRRALVWRAPIELCDSKDTACGQFGPPGTMVLKLELSICATMLWASVSVCALACDPEWRGWDSCSWHAVGQSMSLVRGLWGVQMALLDEGDGGGLAGSLGGLGCAVGITPRDGRGESMRGSSFQGECRIRQ